MSITMRIVQQFDATKEKEFMEWERKFASLEASRPDYPRGQRMQPISGIEACNTLIWQCEFPDMASAYSVLDFFSGDSAHEQLLAGQLPFFRGVHIEFYRNLDF